MPDHPLKKPQPGTVFEIPNAQANEWGFITILDGVAMARHQPWPQPWRRLG